MKHLLVQYSEDWADEFDLVCKNTFTSEQFEEFKKAIPEDIIVRGNLGNVEAENEHTKEDFIDCLRVQELTDNEYEVLNRFDVLGGNCNAFDF